MIQLKSLLLFLSLLFKLSLQEQLSNGLSEPQITSQIPQILNIDPLKLQRRLQSCQPGCLDCSVSPEKCEECDSETTLTGGICICNEIGKYFETGSGCTGNCMEGCDKCINSYECIECSINRVWMDGKCKCESPRILIGTSCECPSYMVENSVTLNCEYIDLIDIAYQPTISPLFNAILQVQINPKMKFDIFPMILWSGDCTFQNENTRIEFQSFLLTQATDILLFPSTLLEFSLQCDITASYVNDNGVEISKQISFTTFSSSQPQVHLSGGPFQILTHTEENFILAEVSSKSGSQIPSASLKVTWTQTEGGDLLDMTKLYSSSSNPLRLTIPKCTLSQGKLYTFKISVKVGTSTTSQEITIGVFSPNIQLQTLQTDNYHIYTEDLTLTASEFSISDTCSQGISPLDFLDLSTTKYTWEYVAIDLTNRRRLSPTESVEITDDPNVSVPPDPLDLFYQSTTSKTLTIPSSYFTQYIDYQFIFYLTTTVQSKDSTPSLTNFNLLQPTTHIITTKAYIRVVDSQPLTTLSFSCTSNNNCEVFSNSFRSKFSVTSTFNSQYSYTWNFNAFDQFQASTAFGTFFTLYTIDPDYPPNGIKLIPRLLLTATDGTNIASAFFTFTINLSPQNGTISIYPQTGEAYKTSFFANLYNWVDEDLPISFQFYTYNSAGGFNLMLKTFQPFAETPVLQPPEPYSSSIGAFVTDSLGSYTYAETYEITVTGGAENWAEVIEKGTIALNSFKTSTMNSWQKFRLINVMLENLIAWETLNPDENYYVKSAKFKYLAIAEMEQLFLDLNSNPELKPILLRNIMYSSQQLFNQDINWKLYLHILDSYYQANTTTPILTESECDLFSQILNDLINYMVKPGTSIEDPDKIFVYINTLTRSMLYNHIPSDDVAIYNPEFFTVFTQKTTYCQILATGIENIYWSSGLDANFTLKPGKTIKPEQCNKQIDFIFLSFRRNYTGFGWGIEFKTIIYVDIRDSITGESLIDLFDFYLISRRFVCPEGLVCNPDNGGEGTTIYGTFDLRNQILKIFEKSNIAQVKNISALKNFKFWKSVAFWTVLGFTISFVVSFGWLYRHPNYCALEVNRNLSKKSLFKKVLMFFLLVHPLVSIYIYNDPKIIKSNKLAIYYQRLIVIMAFSTIFSTIEQGEGTVFKAYIILFNTLTVSPLNGTLSRIFKYLFDLKISHKRRYLRKPILSLAIFFYILLIAACFVVMFIIEAQQEGSQNISWAINFVISFVQDLSLSPVISIFNKILLLRLSRNDRFFQRRRSKQFLHILLPDTFKSIYGSIFKDTTAVITKQTFVSLETNVLGSLSSNRKLIRFNTLESPNPSKSPTPYEFRSRRASETEMNTADILAMETLMSNRFQTLFSEAKPESVKAMSPMIKENFIKMQSSNLYSSSSSPKLQSARSQKSPEKKMINLASIVFSPETENVYSDAAPINEEDVISFDDQPQDTYASSPKTWKGGNTLKNFLSKQKSKKNDSSPRCKTVT